MEGVKKTPWRTFGGEYGPEQKFQVIYSALDPVLFTGAPTLDADGHVYEVWQGPGVFELRLIAIKPDLKTGIYKVGAPARYITFTHTRLFLGLKIKIAKQS